MLQLTPEQYLLTNLRGNLFAKNVTNLGLPGIAKNKRGTNGMYNVQPTQNRRTSRLAEVPRFMYPPTNNRSI